MSMRIRLLKLLNGLRDRAYRALFVETQIETIIPFQIRALRAKKGWTQKQLAKEAGMAQARISILENVSYEGAVNVKTLVKLAAAFDVGLIVRFAPFSEVADWSTRISSTDHHVPDFATEMAALSDGSDDPHPEERTETIQLVVDGELTARFRSNNAHDTLVDADQIIAGLREEGSATHCFAKRYSGGGRSPCTVTLVKMESGYFVPVTSFATDARRVKKICANGELIWEREP